MKTILFILNVIIGAVLYRLFLNTLPTIIALPLAVASMVWGFKGFISRPR